MSETANASKKTKEVQPTALSQHIAPHLFFAKPKQLI
jgi:hypothetical protein